METIMGLISAIDIILQSPGMGEGGFSIMEQFNVLLEKIMTFLTDFNIMEALGALGIF